MNHALARLRLCLIMLLLAVQSSAQSTVPTFPNPGKTSMSKDNQQALGMKVAAEVYKQMPVLPDNSPETQYIRQLGQKLVATIPQQYSWPFEFHVIPQKEINAFALPGGQMFINLGTITAAKSSLPDQRSLLPIPELYEPERRAVAEVTCFGYCFPVAVIW